MGGEPHCGVELHRRLIPGCGRLLFQEPFVPRSRGRLETHLDRDFHEILTAALRGGCPL